MFKKLTKNAFALTAGLGLMLWSLNAAAGLITVTFTENQDCGGNDYAVGSNFENDCSILDSPSIAKIEDDNTVDGDLFEDFSEINFTSVASLAGAEFISNEASVVAGDFELRVEGGILYWNYLKDADDPAIRYFAGKYGGGSNPQPVVIYFESDLGPGCLDAPGPTYDNGSLSTPFNPSEACWASAKEITSGSLSIDSLSHLSFWDTEPRDVPEPGALALLGIGLIGLSLIRRRRA